MKRGKNIHTGNKTSSDATPGNNSILPILVRLSFWIPPERVAEFEAVYQEKIAPLLLQRGLVESFEKERKDSGRGIQSAV